LELDRSEERERIGFVVGHAIGAGGGASSGLVGGRESGESNFGDRSRLGLGRRGAVLKDFSNAPWSSDRSGGLEQSLGKGEPEFQGIAGKGNTGV
jgi:hypothetical protein